MFHRWRQKRFSPLWAYVVLRSPSAAPRAGCPMGWQRNQWRWRLPGRERERFRGRKWSFSWSMTEGRWIEYTSRSSDRARGCPQCRPGPISVRTFVTQVLFFFLYFFFYLSCVACLASYCSFGANICRSVSYILVSFFRIFSKN